MPRPPHERQPPPCGGGNAAPRHSFGIGSGVLSAPEAALFFSFFFLVLRWGTSVQGPPLQSFVDAPSGAGGAPSRAQTREGRNPSYRGPPGPRGRPVLPGHPPPRRPSRAFVAVTTSRLSSQSSCEYAVPPVQRLRGGANLSFTGGTRPRLVRRRCGTRRRTSTTYYALLRGTLRRQSFPKLPTFNIRLF